MSECHDAVVTFLLISCTDIHFQYNGFLFGVFLLSVVRICQVMISYSTFFLYLYLYQSDFFIPPLP